MHPFQVSNLYQIQTFAFGTRAPFIDELDLSRNIWFDFVRLEYISNCIRPFNPIIFPRAREKFTINTVYIQLAHVHTHTTYHIVGCVCTHSPGRLEYLQVTCVTLLPSMFAEKHSRLPIIHYWTMLYNIGSGGFANLIRKCGSHQNANIFIEVSCFLRRGW